MFSVCGQMCVSVSDCLSVCMSACRPVLFQSSECVASSDVVGDVIPYSIALHLLYTRAHPDIRPPYQVTVATQASRRSWKVADIHGM